VDLLFAFVIAMVVTTALIPPLVRVAARLHVLDIPASRKVHAAPMPRVGGIAMAVGALLPLCVWLPMDRTLVAYLLAVLVLLVFGAWDDRVTLGARTKFVGQLIAVLIVMLAGHVSIDSLMLGERMVLPDWLGFSLTLLFLLGITNAINLADGLDGLAGGTTLLCCAALALLAESWEVRFVETVGVVLMGSILGFLRFNSYPARIFMGDAGSQFLGFSVGVLSILLTKQTATPLSTALPLLLIGLPVLDTLIVIVLRLRAGRSPFVADRMHFHHRLLALGLIHHEAVIVIYAVQCLLLLLAWQLRFENDLLIVATFLGFAVLFTGTLTLLERAGWRWRAVATATHRSALARLRVWLSAKEHLPRWSMRVAWLCAAVYLLGVALYANPVPRDIGWLGTLCLLALALGALWRQSSAFAETWLVRGALYVAVMVAVYLDHRMIMNAPLLQATRWIFLPLLALSVAIAMRLSGQRRFEATPLDLLVIFGALVLPNLPGLAGAPSNFGFSAALLVVLCYAVEMIAALGSRLRTALLGAGAVFYVLIAVRGLR
jgi:UDP-GlcNAc:undecaprenyl-phosphate/decaprenyl-phosphate GlcNAc-1-phosphate transferase